MSEIYFNGLGILNLYIIPSKISKYNHFNLIGHAIIFILSLGHNIQYVGLSMDLTCDNTSRHFLINLFFFKIQRCHFPRRRVLKDDGEVAKPSSRG